METGTRNHNPRVVGSNPSSATSLPVSEVVLAQQFPAPAAFLSSCRCADFVLSEKIASPIFSASSASRSIRALPYVLSVKPGVLCRAATIASFIVASDSITIVMYDVRRAWNSSFPPSSPGSSLLMPA